MSLKGRTALVTGASRGIGSEFALGLAECGANIVLHYSNNIEKAEEMRKKITDTGVDCILVQADLRDENCAEIIYEKIKEIDILVLNASVQYKNNWEDIPLSQFSEQMNCNVRASLLLMQKFVPHMKQQNWGRVITVGSVQELKPHPQMLVYSASKAAQTAMAKSLAVQLAPFGITVNNIAPGVILTDRNMEALSDEAYLEKVVSSIPAGYCGEARDCAGILKLLCSDEGRYITGQNIFVDGGKGIS